MPEPEKGLYSKYKVRDSKGQPLDSGCYVLRPFDADGSIRDQNAIYALEEYADSAGGAIQEAIEDWLDNPVGHEATVGLNVPN